MQTTSVCIDWTLYEKAADNDTFQKLSLKLNVERKNRAVESQITIGDSVHLKQPKKDKLDTNFGNERINVMERVGSEIIWENAKSGSVVRQDEYFVRICVD